MNGSFSGDAGGKMRRIFLLWASVVGAHALGAFHAAAHATVVGAWASSQAALDYAGHVLSTGDHKGLPFAIVDKRASTILVYRGDGTLMGASSVLLGQAKGDEIAPGVGERTQARQLRASDRTTPAGRFASEPGHNDAGEAVVWINYAAALAIHRLRPSPPGERRAQRMASNNPLDKRISAGCVVVPVAFYLHVVQPVLGRNRGVVYIMTEDGHPAS